ncbi:endolytic transglycosylase MltG [Streptomyces sp. NPDC050504]|uniref:endolytic transglycosylase MltG n=1 Tax=Streptomyces sp. NPDC050504 TaxID=3365618 RepID=UPI00379F5F8E
MEKTPSRLTRRGRLVLTLVTVLALTAAAVVVALLARGTKEEPGALVVPEGRRAAKVYETVDRALGEDPGTTRKAVAGAELALPPEAKGNPEGYLFPATYPVKSSTTPAGLLAYMVDTANERFGAEGVTSGAKRNGLTVYQAVTVASIVQAEADTRADMGKVARVIRNRTAKGMPLQMDSTLNYALNRSTLDTTHGDTRLDSPYNTYERQGLPPTPIGNPGDQAMDATLAPTPGDWLYFVTVAAGDTRFTADYAEHQKNVEEFNRNRKNGS